MTRKMTLKHLISSALTAAVLLTGAPVAEAQSLFSPAVTVNERVVTWYEVDQRVKFYETIRRLGDLQKIARDELIDDRLRLQAGEALGIEVDDDAVSAGMTEFAGRANLTAEQFVAGLAQNGVDAQTFRDFVRAGLVWRQVVAARFRGRVQVSDAEIDAALGAAGQAGLRVLLSEIIIPVTPQNEGEVKQLANELSTLTSYARFSEAAGRFSAARTRANGGRLDWLPLTNLPAPLRPVILELKPGEVSAPLELEGAIAVFQMRGIEEMPVPATEFAAIEYGVLRLPGGRSPETLARAAEIRGNIDTCDDLYGVNYGGPEAALSIEAKAPADIPRNIAVELAKLDRHEVSTALTSADGSQLLFVMLCGRTAAINEEASREDVAAALRNRRLSSYADGYLAQLRAEATIVEK
ncbi:peptidylprolyl isomerase [Cognatishimia sp. SS12]|uniref:peptidylprolyl isomerase n=1 Tax=Cognatishimia sp. SS12 TaxID=2979465 RepID=UPI0023306DF3|nr:peptidylprolyl isomerase [Cognatishimia sp. SS12]MDC0737307.1 peptidylprolyl isomerase [Cognatishimia sp. SS12]